MLTLVHKDLDKLFIEIEALLRDCRTWADIINLKEDLLELYPDLNFTVAKDRFTETTSNRFINIEDVILMRKLPEEMFKDEVVNYLRKNRIWHFVYHANVAYGLPDIIAIHNGKFIGLELKRKDGKGIATSLQEEVAKSINEAGGVAGIVASIEEVEALLEKAKND